MSAGACACVYVCECVRLREFECLKDVVLCAAFLRTTALDRLCVLEASVEVTGYKIWKR